LVTSSASGAFADKNVGTAKTVTVSGLTLAGSDAGNYLLTQPTPSASVTNRLLTLTAGGITKTYDGNTSASVTLSDNRVPGDGLTSSYSTAHFADRTVGTGKMVTVNGISISGPDAENYTLSATNATATAAITPYALTVTGITADDKTYDGTAVATLGLSSATLVGVVPGDDVTLVSSGTTGAFADETGGKGKRVTVSGLVLSGSDAGNYSLTECTTTADVKAKATVNWGLIGGASSVLLVAVAGLGAWLMIRRRAK
jgi:hypothetical protein